MSNLVALNYLFLFNILLPVFARMVCGEQEARIIRLKKDSYRQNGMRKALFIFGDMMAPDAESGFQQFADDYVGDVYYIQYNHDGCALDIYAKQMIHISSYYSRIDVIGISIGAQVFPTLYEQLPPWKARLFMICPVFPETLEPKQHKILKILVPMLVLFKTLLGILGEIPFIKRDGVRLSISEIVEQLFYVTYGNPLWPDIDWSLRRKTWARLGEYRRGWRSPYGDREMALCDGGKLEFEKRIPGIILAENDKYISKQRVQETFSGVDILYVSGEHADVINNDYRTLLDQIGLYD